MKLLKILGIMAIFLSPISASAHAGLVASTPASNSEISEMPKVISIEFTDDLMELEGKQINSIEITAPDRKIISPVEIVVDANVVTGQLPDINYSDGTYLVDYRVVSADGHPVSGSYEFYLNAPAISATTTSIEHDQHSDFFHVHQTHIIWVGIALILITLWVGYRRFNREQGE